MNVVGAIFRKGIGGGLYAKTMEPLVEARVGGLFVNAFDVSAGPSV